MEVALLREHGHQVIEYTEHNKYIAQNGKGFAFNRLLWSRDAYLKINSLIDSHRPDAAHFHNTFPLISPSVYFACNKMKVPVIQALDNPRLLCPSANFYRNGGLCQECLGKTPPWPSLKYRCYRNSFVETAGVASMLTMHRGLGTWKNKVDAYIVATDFYKEKFIEGGLPKEKFFYKPYFAPDKTDRSRDSSPGEYALFIGRLDPEKGVRVMLNAWVNQPIPLLIRGNGQLEFALEDWKKENPNSPVRIIGRCTREELTRLISRARFLIWPSLGYYETFGIVAIESFANGVPVIASDMGVNAEIVQNGRTGLHFRSGDPSDLRNKVEWGWNHPDEMMEMGRNARREYEEKYTPEKNYEMLMSIYQTAIERNRLRVGNG
jgi:glycosyltransferase involved in cell wall biosynthesis